MKVSGLLVTWVSVVQVLEKALEREKEEAKREKVRRMKNDRAYLEYNQKAQQVTLFVISYLVSNLLF